MQRLITSYEGGLPMPLNFRKSFSLGKLIRINLSKGGLGVSAGVPGFRVSVSPKGKVRRTVSIPGTGLYHTKTVGDVSSAQTPAAQRCCPACGRKVGKTANYCSHCGHAI